MVEMVDSEVAQANSTEHHRMEPAVLLASMEPHQQVAMETASDRVLRSNMVPQLQAVLETDSVDVHRNNTVLLLLAATETDSEDAQVNRTEPLLMAVVVHPLSMVHLHQVATEELHHPNTEPLLHLLLPRNTVLHRHNIVLHLPHLSNMVPQVTEMVNILLHPRNMVLHPVEMDKAGLHPLNMVPHLFHLSNMVPLVMVTDIAAEDIRLAHQPEMDSRRHRFRQAVSPPPVVMDTLLMVDTAPVDLVHPFQPHSHSHIPQTEDTTTKRSN